MENDLISIIVPVYRAESYIRQTIRQVLLQTWKDWELILVDDCSPDGSLEAIQEGVRDAGERGKQIRVLSNDVNLGAAKSRNRGTAAAHGRYIAFLDADDIWMPEKLESELAFMRKTGAAFACHSYEFGDENAGPTGRVVHAVPRLTYKKALSRTVVFTSTVMFDMEQLTKEEILMPDCPSEDTALWWQLMREGHDCYGLDRVLAVYRRPSKSLSSNKVLAVKRIWFLYRKREGLSVPASVWHMAGWAVRAAARRI